MSKVILVTGGNAGIGFELVRLLAEKGHIVYIGARNELNGKAAQEKLHAEGFINVKYVNLDVTRVSTVEAAKESIENAEGRLNVLVNNAGNGMLGSNQNATSVEPSVLREAMEINFFGLVQTTTALLPLLRRANDGVIVNVGSPFASIAYLGRADTTNFHEVAYNASKAALNSYTFSLAYELEKEDNIKVNVVTPGLTSTKLNGYRQGGKTMKESAEALMPFALLDKDGPTGKFFDWNGNEFPW